MRTIDQIINSIKLELSAQNSKLSQFNGFSTFYLICRTIAKSLLEVEAYVEEQDNRGYIETLQGLALDLRANELGLFRLTQGSKVRGTVLASSQFQSRIPEGLILTDPITRIQFKTVGSSVIDGLNVPITVEALLAQQIDLPAGTVLVSSIYSEISFVVGKTKNLITNEITGDIIGGSPTETDEELRFRILQRLSNQSAATVTNLTSAISNVEGVNRTFIKSNDPTVGYLTVYIDSNDALVLEEVSSLIEANKAAGINYLIKPIRFVNLDIAVDISLRLTASLNTVEQSVRQIINEYVTSLSLGQPFIIGELVNRLYRIGNVTNITFNQPNDDIQIQSNNLFRVNNINVRLGR